jgi:hypothetical protein
MLTKDYQYKWIPNSQVSSTTQRIVDSLTTEGKKGKIESLVRSLWRKNTKTSNKDVELSPVTKQIKIFALNATPFVGLQTRRRGKRPVVKIITIPRKRGERKAITSLKKNIQEVGAVSQPFSTRIQRQLQSLSSTNSTKSRVSGTSFNTRESRDELHRLAFSSIPRYWIR